MKIRTLILLLTIAQWSHSQSIYNYSKRNDERLKGSGIKEVVETTTFYSKDGEHKEIVYRKIDSSSNTTHIQKFNEENKLIFIAVNQFDNQNRIIRNDSKMWINIIGFQTTYTIFEYDTLKNFVEKEYNNSDRLIQVSRYYFDDNSDLVRLEIYSDNVHLIGYETATYDHENNRMTVNHYGNKGNLINTEEDPIHFGGKYKQEDPTNKYNEQGDLIYSERGWDEKDRVCYTYDYEYDAHGNQTLEKRYEYIKNAKGQLKNKKIDMVFTREIKYIDK